MSLGRRDKIGCGQVEKERNIPDNEGVTQINMKYGEKNSANHRFMIEVVLFGFNKDPPKIQR